MREGSSIPNYSWSKKKNMKLEKGKKNLLEFSNSKVFSSRNMSLMKKRRKKIISGKSLIEKVRNEQKYKLKVKWNTKVRNYN